MKRFLALAVIPVMLAGAWGTALAVENDRVKLGHDLVEHLGCLYCHGLGGRQGIANPNAKRQYVPAWDEPAFIERFQERETIRATIIHGRFPEQAEGATGRPIPMPPWGNRLTDTELDAIISYIWSLRETPVETHDAGGLGEEEEEEDTRSAILALQALKNQPDEDNSLPEGERPQDPQAALGLALVEHLGCLHCHGLGGRQGLSNPNAVRKYVPAWDEEAFIARYPVDDGVRYVITSGRFPAKDPKAVGSPVPMPPWGNRLKPEEMDAIVAYIWSLRENAGNGH